MANKIKATHKELRRIGCGVTVSPVEGRPDLCQVDNAGELTGRYKAERLLNVLSQLRAPDAGAADGGDVYALLAQIGFEDRG